MSNRVQQKYMQNVKEMRENYEENPEQKIQNGTTDLPISKSCEQQNRTQQKGSNKETDSAWEFNKANRKKKRSLKRDKAKERKRMSIPKSPTWTSKNAEQNTEGIGNVEQKQIETSQKVASKRREKRKENVDPLVRMWVVWT